MIETKINKKLNEISVFFPCYNEEENLPKLLESAVVEIPKVANKYEIIVINDGSNDKTSEIAHTFASKYPFIRVVDHEKNSGGYGGALKSGLKECKYDWIFFTDADLQFKLADINKLTDEVQAKNVSMVLGYRIKRAEGFKRDLLAKSLKVWSRIFLSLPLSIKDVDCAYKLLRREILENTGELISSGNLVSTELLVKAIKNSYKYTQVGIKHYPRATGLSKCGGIKDIRKVVEDTIKVLISREGFE